MGILFSPYQHNIFSFVEDGVGHLQVEAVAGSGKTFTLKHTALRLVGKNPACKIMMLAFNNHIKTELARVMALALAGAKNVEVKTSHSYGWFSLFLFRGKVPPVLSGNDGESKYQKLAEEFLHLYALDNEEMPKEIAEALMDKSLTRGIVNDIKTLHNYSRSNLVDLADEVAFNALLAKYQFTPQHLALVVQGAKHLLKRGREVFEATGEIDFTDMLHLAVTIPGMQYLKRPYVFVDECQDLSPLQLELILRAITKDGRFLFVGDARQAIYGWVGADVNSFDNIQSRTGARRLPLSVNYRCPKSSILLAKRVVPQIEYHEAAQEGILRIGSTAITAPMMLGETEGDSPDVKVREGDLVLCRLTAPLVTLCIRLIKSKISARVRGRDVGGELCSILETIKENKGHRFRFEELPQYLTEFEEGQIKFLEGKNASEPQLEAARDRFRAIEACITSFGCDDFADLISEIKKLFEDDLTPKELASRGLNGTTVYTYNGKSISSAEMRGKTAVIELEDGSVVEFDQDDTKKAHCISRRCVWLSTIHRAKGLEEKRVFIISPEKLPLMWSKQQEWELEQEMNLWYVAVTRNTEALYIVGEFPIKHLNAPLPDPKLATVDQPAEIVKPITVEDTAGLKNTRKGNGRHSKKEVGLLEQFNKQVAAGDVLLLGDDQDEG